jgi:hypothetical protein
MRRQLGSIGELSCAIQRQVGRLPVRHSPRL